MMNVTPWRLLITPPARGPWNMAVDEAILEACGRGDSLATLRLYAWEPACLSLGYAQPLADVDRARLDDRAWDLVRRPTGGRAVLHVDELTYAVIGPPNEKRLAGGVLESYNRLAAALVDALHRMAVPVEIKERAEPGQKNHNPVCFEVPSTYEITVDGRKLVGSAQARRREGVLQHGSLPLMGDLSRIMQVLVFPDETARQVAADRLLERATTVETVLGRKVSWEEAAAAFREAFSTILLVDLQPGILSPWEQARAGELVADKYSHPEWTGKQQS